MVSGVVGVVFLYALSMCTSKRRLDEHKGKAVDEPITSGRRSHNLPRTQLAYSQVAVVVGPSKSIRRRRLSINADPQRRDISPARHRAAAYLFSSSFAQSAIW